MRRERRRSGGSGRRGSDSFPFPQHVENMGLAAELLTMRSWTKCRALQCEHSIRIMPRSRYEGEDSGSGGKSCREALRAWASVLRRAFRVGVSSASLDRWVERRSRSRRAATTGDISTALACCVAIRSERRRASRIGLFSSALARRVAMRSASRRASRRGVDCPGVSFWARLALRALALSLHRRRRSSRCSDGSAALRAAVRSRAVCRGSSVLYSVSCPIRSLARARTASRRARASDSDSCALLILARAFLCCILASATSSSAGPAISVLLGALMLSL